MDFWLTPSCFAAWVMDGEVVHPWDPNALHLTGSDAERLLRGFEEVKKYSRIFCILTRA